MVERAARTVELPPDEELVRTGRVWRLVIDGERPWTVNGERKMTPHERAAIVDEWRQRGGWIAKAEKVPHLARVLVRARPLVKNRAAMQDVGNCLPAVKAVIDGLVDVGVLPDDTPVYLRELSFQPSAICGIDGLLVVIEELEVP